MGDVDIQNEQGEGGNSASAKDAYEPMPQTAWCDFTFAIQNAAKNLATLAQQANTYGRSNPQNQEAHILMMLGSFAALEQLRRRVRE